ncbi:MAG: VapC toxin family PIN domain ribonuclease [Acidobacteria bacterium]|nr:VapC toxin family PIN domain ribonuclease [Acidobacteriota bacterium]MBI3279864.1 VapC toxin family PIN domain ribonuclease [Acidobacteriota bacterium]
MSVSLLDVNILIALFDTHHIHHTAAYDWFRSNRTNGWATSPLTLNGCVRILSNPRNPTISATPAEVITALNTLCSDPHHHFWPDDVNLLDPTLFLPHLIASHHSLTDLYLLGLAVRHGGRLATFDRSIRTHAVIGAEPRYIELIPV